MRTVKLSEWQNGENYWYAADTGDLKNGSAVWWRIPRYLGIPLTDYILLLKEKYNATLIHYNEEKDVLIFGFKEYNDCHKYVLDMNKRLRNVRV